MASICSCLGMSSLLLRPRVATGGSKLAGCRIVVAVFSL